MRNMAFSMTTPQYVDYSKDITRRQGWLFLKKGDHVMAVEQGMGLKKGQKVKKLGAFEVLSNTRVPIDEINQSDVDREGFPDMSPEEFIAFYCDFNRVNPGDMCSRIEFRRL